MAFPFQPSAPLVFLFVVGLSHLTGCQQQPGNKSDDGVQTTQVTIAVTGMN